MSSISPVCTAGRQHGSLWRLGSLLLTTAAGVAPIVEAEAADLPSRNGSPSDYAQICNVPGPGFFYIPGSDICIRIGGRARFEYVLSKTFQQGSDPSSFRALGRIVVDARTRTDWGLLRADVRLDLSRDTGNNWFGSGNGARSATRITFEGPAGTFPDFSGADTVGNRLQTGVAISNAFVQWNGLTAGRLQSFFDFYAGNDTWFGITDSKVLTQALAYTYSFGSGFSATLAIEDPKERQLLPVAGIAPIVNGGILQPNPFPGPGSPFSNFSITYPPVLNPFAAPFLAPGGIIYTQRESIPDLVGVFRADQGWGSAQLSGAYHRIEISGSTITNSRSDQSRYTGLHREPVGSDGARRLWPPGRQFLGGAGWRQAQPAFSGQRRLPLPRSGVFEGQYFVCGLGLRRNPARPSQ